MDASDGHHLLLASVDVFVMIICFVHAGRLSCCMSRYVKADPVTGIRENTLPEGNPALTCDENKRGTIVPFVGSANPSQSASSLRKSQTEVEPNTSIM